jgi:hypothetical protein
VFVFFCFSGEARFFVLSRFLLPACLFYITLAASRGDIVWRQVAGKRGKTKS